MKNFRQGAMIVLATIAGWIGGSLIIIARAEPPAEQPQTISIPSTPENSICQDPYYQVSGGPNEPTVCALKEGYTDCHNFTAVPAGQECTSGPQPYQEPVTKPEPAKPTNTCQEG